MLALVLLGVGIFLTKEGWEGTHPDPHPVIKCDNKVMHPGDFCRVTSHGKSSSSSYSYEKELNDKLTVSTKDWVELVIGLALIVGAGGYLLLLLVSAFRS
ncbi:hypothetical protein A9W99_02750 [Mycobacterium sp. 1164966.3]|nr:hypothetical protein A9W99_02750 [Mycobacterium sp. 1164966.3]